MRILMQQADAAGGGQGAGAAAAAPVVAGADKTTAGAGKDAAAGQQGAQASQGQAQQQTSKDGKPTETSKVDGADKAKPVAPAELAIKLPDGTKADPKFVESYVASAKKLGFSQEQAQGMAEFLVAEQSQGVKAFEAALQQQVAKETETLRSDKDYGGQNFDKTMKARDSLLDQAGKEWADKVRRDGVVSVTDPLFVKLLANLKSLSAEDSVGDKGTKPGASPLTREQELRRMFPNSYEQMVKPA